MMQREFKEGSVIRGGVVKPGSGVLRPKIYGQKPINVMTLDEGIRKAAEEIHESIKSTAVAAVKVWVKESPDAESFVLDVEFPNTNIDHIATVITCNLFEATQPMSKDEIMNRARNGVDLIISPLLDGIIASMRKVGFEYSDESAFRKIMWDSREDFANIIRIAMTQKEIERVEDAPPAPMTSVIKARPFDEWHEDYGPALWWKFPVEEPPYIGGPSDCDWPGYHTHWTAIIVPDLPESTE